MDLLIWDLDGTLIDSRRDIAHCVNWTLQDMDLAPIPHEHIYRYVGHGVRALIQGAVEEAHGHDYNSAMKIFDSHYRAHLLDHTRLYAGMSEVLDYYGDKKMAIITNKPQHYTDPIIEGLQIGSYFEAILGREACEQMKPHPQPLLKVMDMLSVREERTVMIGDTEIDIEAGKRAGVQTCGVLFGFGQQDTVRMAEPDYLVEQVTELKSVFTNEPKA